MRGKVNPGSGNKRLSRGDVKSKTHIISCKRTDKQSISLKVKDWAEVCDIAMEDGKYPAMHINVGGVDLVVIAASEFFNGIPE